MIKKFILIGIAVFVIFMTVITIAISDSNNRKATMGIIGGADGPTEIFVSR